MMLNSIIQSFPNYLPPNASRKIRELCRTLGYTKKAAVVRGPNSLGLKMKGADILAPLQPTCAMWWHLDTVGRSYQMDPMLLV